MARQLGDLTPVGPRKRKKSHKKAFGFSLISLSESSLFKGLRRPLRPEFL
jgi:hypothetical protein